MERMGREKIKIVPRPWIEMAFLTSSRWNKKEKKIGAGACFENKA